MDWPSFCAGYLQACRARGAAPTTLSGYAGDLRRFAAWYREALEEEPQPETVTPIDLADYRRHLVATGKPATANRRLAVLKGAFRWAADERILPKSPALHLRPVPEVISGPQGLEHKDLNRLLRAVQREGNSRDVALVTLLAQTGLRISEALSLRWGDVVVRERSGHVAVRGKGDRRREVPLTLTARQALTAWKASEWPEKAPAPAPVFPGRGGRPLTSRAVQQAFARYARRAGIEVTVTPHTLRHTFCKGLVDAGESLDRVAALAGHASLNTTARYTRPTRADLERAVGRLEWV